MNQPFTYQTKQAHTYHSNHPENGRTHTNKRGSEGSGNLQFYSPRGIAVDSSGYVYIADTSNSRVQKTTSNGAYVIQWDGSPDTGNSKFRYPKGVAVDSSGNVYVTDTGNDRIQKFTSSGVYVMQWGSSGARNSQFNGPNGIAVDGSGNVYIVDTNNNRIQKFAPVSSLPFLDGFEFGSFSAWSGTSVSTGETATVSTSAAHHGLYSSRFTSNGGGGIKNAIVNRTFTASTDIYARGYFKVTQNGIADDNDRFYFTVLKSTVGNNLAYAGWRRTAGVLHWCLVIRAGTGYVTTYSASTPVTDRWYYMEVHWREGSPGVGELWVDGGQRAHR